MMNRRILIQTLSWILITGFTSPAMAQEEEIIIILDEDDETLKTPGPPPTPPFEQKVQFRGALTNDGSLDWSFDGPDERIFRSFHRLSLGANVDVSPKLTVQVSGRMTYWAWAKEDGMERYEFDPELRDTYVHWDAPDIMSGTVGLQTWSWGVSEFFPTADSLNPRDLRTGPSSGLETPKVPAFGLSLNRPLGDSFHIEMAWIPFYVEDKTSVMATDYGLLGTSSSTGPGAGFAQSFGSLLEDIDPSALDDVDELLFGLNRPDEGLENSSGGARVTGSLGQVDTGLSYIYGWDPTPRLLVDPCLPTTLALLNGEIAPEDLDTAALTGIFLGTDTLPSDEAEPGSCSPEQLIENMFSGELDILSMMQTRRLRQHTIGADLVFPLGDLMGRLESSWSPHRIFYTQSLDSIRKPVIATTAGVEYAYDTIFNVVAEFNHLHILNLPTETELFLFAQNQLQGGLVVAMRFLEYDALEIQLGGLYGITMEEWIALPSIGYRFFDGYLLQIGARIFEGEGNSAGALYDNNDEIFVLSQWNF